MTIPEAKRVLYFAENAISSVQGGGIVVYNVLKGLPAENLLGFFQYRNITPAPEYRERFHFIGPERIPGWMQRVRRRNRFLDATVLSLTYDHVAATDLAFVERVVSDASFKPEVVYFSGLSLRFMRLAVLAAERYDVPMVLLHMDDWMEAERHRFGRWGDRAYRRIVFNMTRAAARSLASTTNSPSLANKVTELTGHEHKPANNCCEDLLELDPDSTASWPEVPVITYAGALNWHLQGETLVMLASAIAELNAEGTRVELHIYAPWEFAPIANANEIPGAVFYKGQVSKEQLVDVYRNSTFLVSSTTFRRDNLHLFRHSLSTKLSEYLSVGKPVLSIGHPDWHLHEYVQEHTCGFSIYTDENYKRAIVKQQIIEMLETPQAELEEIGRRNRVLWERAHDVRKMSTETRRALNLPVET
ncbi:MAG: hypothetical protein KDI88_04090 [Gammaproteobacteria bacterium]|nr:hypothetical protein [Gammaproteobacteria bacterium]